MTTYEIEMNEVKEFYTEQREKTKKVIVELSTDLQMFALKGNITMVVAISDKIANYTSFVRELNSKIDQVNAELVQYMKETLQA